MMNKTNILTVSIIAMMAVGSVRADIASTNYVNAQIQPVSQALAGKQDKAMITVVNDNYSTDGQTAASLEMENQNTRYLSGAAVAKYVDDTIVGYMGTLNSDIQNLGDNKADKATDLTGATKTKITYNNQGIVTGGADLEASDIPNIATSKVNALTGYAKGTSSEALATSDSLNSALGKLENKADSLKSRIDTAEGDISQLGTQISTLSSDSQVKSTADYQVGKQGGGWTTLDTNQVAAINSGATSALVGKISTNEAAINKLNGTGDGSVANSIASALTSYSTTAQMNAALDNKADKTTIGTVPENSTVMAEIAKAQNAATYNDTALKNRVAAIEESDAYKSGIDSTKVAQIATNASNISTLQSGKQDKIDAQHKLSTDLIANDAGFITKDVNNLTNYTTTTAMNNALGNKQDKIDSSHKLDADLVDDSTSTHKFVTEANKTTWSGKQNAIGGTAGQLVATTSTAGTVAYTPSVPSAVPETPNKDGMFVLTAKVVNSTPTFYWEDIGR